MTADSPIGVAFELDLHQSVVPELGEKQSVTRAQRVQLATKLDSNARVTPNSVLGNNN